MTGSKQPEARATHPEQSECCGGKKQTKPSPEKTQSARTAGVAAADPHSGCKSSH